eukprot:GFUD01029802.1.p1 GENE.GFUD01029802.1~~GFUD01029802.1.p1  ORF type:complete len:294 (+),score=28.40 GFUD01029802.1:140-1021(+)
MYSATILLILAICLPLRAASAAYGEEQNCIESPEAYVKLLESVLAGAGSEHCVSRALMGTIIGPVSCPGNPNTLEYLDARPKNYWAWVSGSPNLEQYLVIGKKYAGQPFEAAKKMLSFAGISELNPNCSYYLAVFHRENLEGLFPPTWASLFLQLEKHPFNVTLNWDVSRRLAKEVDGLSSFKAISNCTSDVIDPTCRQDYQDTYHILHKIIMSEQGTIACIEMFRDMFDNGLTANLSQARAFFHVCLDANPYFTGLGYGYSTETLELTGREYLARNTRLDQVKASNLSLYTA